MHIKIPGFPQINVTSFSAYTAADAAQVETITAVADVADSLNNKFFFLYTPGDAAVYLLWFNTGAGVAPSVPNTTSVEVTITTNATADAVGLALRTAINAIGGAGVIYVTSGATNQCIVTHQSVGGATSMHDPNLETGTDVTAASGMGFVNTTPGTNVVTSAADFWRIQGSFADIKAVQQGNQFIPIPFARVAVDVYVHSHQIVYITP